MRAALTRTYGTRVQETSVPMGYTLEWDPVLERYVIVCSLRSTYEVSFGTRGTVEVEVRETERVP